MKPLRVSELNSYIKKLFSSDMILSNIQIEGEISNFLRHTSGHLYFSLKDGQSIVKCVMFRRDALNNIIELSEGQKVIVEGYVSIYDQTSQYQFYVKKVKDNGLGTLYKSYQKLKERLEEEGLFNQKYKKPLPFLPQKIGVVTSPTGAAVHDIINIINRRFPFCQILIYPSLVQGASAYKEIINGLNYLDNDKSVDVIIFGRGGGSLEDLFCFNNEELARTVFNLNTPAISAVGHETDFTIVDFIADLRAPTPSAAAELAVPNKIDLENELKGKYNKLTRIFKRRLNTLVNNVNLLETRLKYNSPNFKLRNNKQDIDIIYKDLVSLIYNQINKSNNSLLSLESKLKLLDPLLSLESGHGILINNEGKVIKSSDEIKINDSINIKLKDVELEVLVKDIKRESNLYEKQ